MGRRSRRKRERRRLGVTPQTTDAVLEGWPAEAAFACGDTDGLHTMTPGDEPTAAQLEEMSRVYQQKIRESPAWQVMVQELGIEKAEQTLQGYRAEPGKTGTLARP